MLEVVNTQETRKNTCKQHRLSRSERTAYAMPITIGLFKTAFDALPSYRMDKIVRRKSRVVRVRVSHDLVAQV